MVDKKRDNPSHGNLEQGCQSSPTPAAGFFLDGGQCGGTGNVEQGKGHQGIGVQCAEANGTQGSHKRRHACVGSDVGDAEEHRTAGDHHFLGGDTGDQSHYYLPISQTNGSKEP